VLFCTVDDVPVFLVLDVLGWKFGPMVCGRLERAEGPRVDTGALRPLQAVLERVVPAPEDAALEKHHCYQVSGGADGKGTDEVYCGGKAGKLNYVPFRGTAKFGELNVETTFLPATYNGPVVLAGDFFLKVLRGYEGLITELIMPEQLRTLANSPR